MPGVLLTMTIARSEAHAAQLHREAAAAQEHALLAYSDVAPERIRSATRLRAAATKARAAADALDRAATSLAGAPVEAGV